MPQKECMGFHSIKNLKKILAEHKPSNIFLVTGKDSYAKSGAKSVIDKFLEDYNVIHFDNFGINPKLPDIKKGIGIFKENNCDFVIAVGGGTVLDIAKSINILASGDCSPVDCIKNKKRVKNKGSPLVAVPTTSGSGSEATKFAVVYINKIKHSLEHEFILPDYCIVDPQFTMNLPKSITAYTGMDALSQAIESYWSINSIGQAKSYAREAIKLIVSNLSDAVNNPSKKSRKAMAKAAHLAGKAINITKTTACHAISYPMTSYLNVPHGHAVISTIPSMLIYNSNVTKDDLLDKRGVNYVKKTIMEIVKFLGAPNAKEASAKIANLMKQIGLSTKLSELGINTNDDIEIIIKNGFNPERVKNNPRKLTRKDLREMLNWIR